MIVVVVSAINVSSVNSPMGNSGTIQRFESVILEVTDHVVRYWFVWLIDCMVHSTRIPVFLSQ